MGLPREGVGGGGGGVERLAPSEHMDIKFLVNIVHTD